jgi:hypothetical protein
MARNFFSRNYSRIKNIVNYISDFNEEKLWYGITTTDSDNINGSDIRVILENPAAVFLFSLLPDLASMGKFKLKKISTGEEIERHEILTALQSPNPMQTQEQFVWDYMFYRLLGTASLYIDSKASGFNNNKFYWLTPDCIYFPEWFNENKNKLFLSKASIAELNKKVLYYYQDVGLDNKLPIQYGQLKRFHDLSNSIEGWFETPSRIPAIRKILTNSENSLDSKRVTSHLAQKYMVSGHDTIDSHEDIPMNKREKKSIESAMRSKQNVFAFKRKVDVNSFVKNAEILGHLDKSMLHDAFLIAKVLKNIPKDAIELLGDSTYENQEKGKASIISYCVQPAMNDLASGILSYFGVTDLEITVDFSHLPFVQVFEEQMSKTNLNNARAFSFLVEAGLPQEKAAEQLGIEYDGKFNDPINIGDNTKSRKQDLDDKLEVI